jgi:hypothetical protein
MDNEPSSELGDSNQEQDSVNRRLFLRSVGKWSAAAIAAVGLWGAWLATAPESKAGIWVNRWGPRRRGRWINRWGPRGRWINRWGPRRGGWVNWW